MTILKPKASVLLPTLMKFYLVVLGILVLRLKSVHLLQCSASFGLSIPTMCRVSGGSVNADEDLQISNANPIAVTTLTFDSTSFTSIPRNTFRNFPKVTLLYISKNNLETLTEDSFQGATSLTNLAFWDTKITAIPDGVFKLCTALKQLRIHNNPMSEITGRPFLGLNTLQLLELTDMLLSTFDSAVLADLEALEKIKINNCSLTYISSDFFANNPKLTDIDISGNNIATIESEAFDMLKGLQNLNVAYNMITSLYTSFAQTVVANHNELKSLSIGSSTVSLNVMNNKLTHITCEDNLKMKLFYASKNRLSKIMCVRKMTSVLVLNLDSNRLVRLNKNIFSGLVNITNFDISFNPRLKLGTAMISNMKNLKQIKVDRLASGYKSLRTNLPKLYAIYLTTRNWDCSRVTRVANVLNTQQIYMFFNNFTMDRSNFKCHLNSYEVSFFNVTR